MWIAALAKCYQEQLFFKAGPLVFSIIIIIISIIQDNEHTAYSVEITFYDLPGTTLFLIFLLFLAIMLTLNMKLHCTMQLNSRIHHIDFGNDYAAAQQSLLLILRRIFLSRSLLLPSRHK